MQPEVASPELPELHLHSVAIVSFSVLLLPLCSRSPFGGCFCAPSFVCVCAEGAFIVECKKKEKKKKREKKTAAETDVKRAGAGGGGGT